jgi:type IV pilus assembly protein PilV
MIRPSRGFTLLEVLIALVVFSLGMLGLAALMVMSVRTNHSAFLRTQASFLGQAMADRMRANPMAIWTNSYNDTYPTGDALPNCAAGCTTANLAVRDKALWSQQLSDQLGPTAAATIACTPTAGIVSPNPAANPPYNGLCSMQIQWSEAAAVQGAAADAQTQTFAWVFQP